MLTDFGMCFDHAEHHQPAMTMEYHFDMVPKGGAQDALAPEIQTTLAGPGVVLDYGKNDTWAAGLVTHEVMAGEPDHAFPDFKTQSAKGAADAAYVDVDPALYDETLREVVRELLRVIPADRMAAGDALARLSAPPPSMAVEPEPQLPAAGTTQLVVKQASGAPISLQVSLTDTVDSVMDQLQALTGIPKAEQRLIFGRFPTLFADVSAGMPIYYMV